MKQRTLLVGYLTGCGILLTLVASRRPLWYDELFSWYVVRLGSPRAIVEALLAGVDNGPPVDYLLRHFFVAGFGDGLLSFRALSILCYALASLCLWGLVRRRASSLAAWTAMIFPCGTMAWYFATEGRAYAPLFFSAVAAMLCWQRAADGPRARLAAVGLALSLGAAPLIHYYGVLHFIPITAGEGLRSWRRRAVSPPILAAILVALLPLLLLPPFARNAETMRAAFWADSFGFGTPWFTYARLLGGVTAGLVTAAVILLVLLRWRRTPFPQHELLALSILAATPFGVVAMAALYTNAVTERYSLVAVAGLAGLVGVASAVLSRRRRIWGWALITLVAAWSLRAVWYSIPGRDAARLDPELASFLASANSVVVFESPQRFLTTYQLLPAEQREQILYVYDRSTSRAVLGHDNNEIAIPGLQQVEPLPAMPLSAFMSRQNEFFLAVDRKRYWLGQELEEKGLRLDSVRTIGHLTIYRVVAPSKHG